jgi:hypothetical protein
MMKFKNMLLAAALFAVAGANAGGKSGRTDFKAGFSTVLFHLEPYALVAPAERERVELVAEQQQGKTNKIRVYVYDKAGKKTSLGLIELQ